MFSNEYGEAAVEVLDILDNTNKIDVDKIPSNFIKFLVDNASEKYESKLDHSKLVSQMNLKEKTKELLGYIYINWWCDKEDKEKYINRAKELEIKRQEEIKENYDIDKVFEKRRKIVQETDEVNDTVENEKIEMIEYKESIFNKIKNKILNIFK